MGHSGHNEGNSSTLGSGVTSRRRLRAGLPPKSGSPKSAAKSPAAPKSSLAERCRPAFAAAASALEGGAADVAAGLVTIYSADSTVVTASVRDVGHRYTVMLTDPQTDDGARLEVFCSCATYRLGRLCRHVWATLLAADSQPERPDPATPGPVTLVFDRDVVGAVDTSARPDQPVAESEGDLLPAVRARIDALRALSEESSKRTLDERRALILDLTESRRRQALVLGIASARPGESLRPLQALPAETADGDGEFRGLLRLLTQSRTDRFRSSALPLSVADDVALPLLEVALMQGPIFLQRSETDLVELERGFSKSAHVVLFFRRETTENSVDAVIDASLNDGGQRIPLSELSLALPCGIFILGNRIGVLADRRAAPWLHSLWREGEIRVPWNDRDKLIGLIFADPIPVDAHFDASFDWIEDGSALTPVATFEPAGGTVCIRLLFQYGGQRVALTTGRKIFVDGTRRRLLRRNEAEEERRRQEIDALVRSFGATGETSRWDLDARRLPEVRIALANLGWALEWRGRRLRQTRPKKRLRVRDSGSWLELDGEWDFDGLTVAIPDVLKALRTSDDSGGVVELPDGTALALTEEERVRWGTIAALAKSHQGKLRVPRSQLFWLAAVDDGSTLDVDEAARRWLAAYDALSKPRTVNLDPGFRGTLRPYQALGVGWLTGLADANAGGILADDMGLGKTVQCLAWLLERRRRYQEPSLVVVPKSLLANWEQEAARFTPELRLVVYAGPQRAKVLEGALENSDLILVTYQTLLRDVERLSRLRYDAIVLDEAQAIKNGSSLTARACRSLEARLRIAMTGTPVENGADDLVSILRFANPELMSGPIERAFRATGGEGGFALLARTVRPFILRRTKESVLSELPPKTETDLFVEFDEEAADEYKQLVAYYRAQLSQAFTEEGLRANAARVLEALLRLRQFACHPGLLDPNRIDESSPKVELLLEQLKPILENGRKALVFSQFRKFLEIVARHLNAAGIRYETFHGGTKDRSAVVERFQSNADCPVLLVTLKAGGLGLNLTAADYVFLLDPWWNPAAEAQAIDRAHRIGQTRPVFAYRMVARGTVEERVLALQREKRAVAQELVPEGTSRLGTLTVDDLRQLLDG